MNIALIGYGQMGHMLKTCAAERGHTVVLTVDAVSKDADYISQNPADIAARVKQSGAEGIIEFTHPTAVLGNINALIPTHIPLVVGTTGWNDKLNEVADRVRAEKSHLFHAANYSIGMNLFYRIVADAAKLVASYDEYDCALWEAHHIKKADSPSGTALVLAQKILDNMPSKTAIVTDAFHDRPAPGELHVSSTRIGSVPGTHTVFFDSCADSIELTHTVRSRSCLALGAVRALEWLTKGATDGTLGSGVYSMDDIFA